MKVNLEYLARVAFTNNSEVVYPDSVVGTGESGISRSRSRFKSRIGSSVDIETVNFYSWSRHQTKWVICLLLTYSTIRTLASPVFVVFVADSHTTMINGLGVLGWGVGGVEAEAVMLGQPISMVLPKVVGYKITGKVGPFVTSTDVVLTITKHLRQV